MEHYLQYWRPETVAYDLDQSDATGDWRLEHTASNQLRHVKGGDVVWVITMEDGRLYLIGRMEVDVVVNQKEAARILKYNDLWEADYHALAAPGTESDMTVIDITDLAPKLRFQGTVDRLPAGFTGRNLQTMRKLTPVSADLIEATWSEFGEGEHPIPEVPEEAPTPKRATPSPRQPATPAPKRAPSAKTMKAAPPQRPSPRPRHGAEKPKKARGQATNASKRKAVEIHAMKAAQAHFREQGFAVEDVSSNKPYDLICRKGRSEILVEVKGMQADGSTVNLTRNEVTIAQDPTTKTVLFMVYSIKVANTGRTSTASGGFIRIIDPWSPANEHLTATQYTCRIST